jgi:hypothetical protein
VRAWRRELLASGGGEPQPLSHQNLMQHASLRA